MHHIAANIFKMHCIELAPTIQDWTALDQSPSGHVTLSGNIFIGSANIQFVQYNTMFTLDQSPGGLVTLTGNIFIGSVNTQYIQYSDTLDNWHCIHQISQYIYNLYNIYNICTGSVTRWTCDFNWQYTLGAGEFGGGS